MRPTNLPAPGCRLGYTTTQLLGILGPERAARFHKWMSTRTYADCDRRTADDDARGSGPHGRVIPPDDLKAFLKREEAT